MRRYARASFALLPTVDAAGVLAPDRPRPPADAGIEEADRAAAIERAAPISRTVRGAAHGDDVGVLLDMGRRALLLGARGFVVHQEGTIAMLAARDEEAGALLLQAALAAAPPGATVQVNHLTAGQDWAVRTCLDAGLALSPGGPVFARGDVGPLRPYIPSGGWL
jgi:hypothetical protein